MKDDGPRLMLIRKKDVSPFQTYRCGHDDFFHTQMAPDVLFEFHCQNLPPVLSSCCCFFLHRPSFYHEREPERNSKYQELSPKDRMALKGFYLRRFPQTHFHQIQRWKAESGQQYPQQKRTIPNSVNLMGLLAALVSLEC